MRSPPIAPLGRAGLVALVLCFAAATSNALAESFRCRGGLVDEGMAAAVLAEKCGAPDTKRTSREPVLATRPNGTRFQVGVKVIEYWTYDRGSGRFPVSIRIEDGIAKTIEFLPRG
jgi:Protein of unknown function (DUF2845)